ncbi:MAG TPA: tetratricopeptide repeat protein [Leptolyngbyaceae cyanobacterium]
MSPQLLLHLVASVSSLVVIAWHTGPQAFMGILSRAAQAMISAQEQMRFHMARGALYCQFGEWEEATDAYLTASDWARATRDPLTLGIALNGLGTVLLYRQRYELAGQCFREAVFNLKHTKDHSQYALALHNLGVTYYLLGCYRAALKCLEKASSIRSELWDVAGEAITLSWMGRVYCSQKQFAYALACYEAAIELAQRKAVAFDGTWFEAGLRCHIAQLAEQCGHSELAIGHYLDALKLVESLGIEWSLPILQALGQLHEQAENPAMAMYYRQQVLEIAEQVGALSKEGNGVAIAQTLSNFAPNHPLGLYF